MATTVEPAERTEARKIVEAVDGKAIAAEIRAMGVTHVITVPDTNLKTAITALEAMPSIRMLYVCTEDEAMGINAGLYMTGHKPMLLIQNNGLYACENTLKSIALDAEVPTFMLIGQYGRQVDKTIEDNRLRAVRLVEPTLALWGIPSFRLDFAEDLPSLRKAWDLAWERKAPSAVVVGAPSF